MLVVMEPSGFLLGGAPRRLRASPRPRRRESASCVKLEHAPPRLEDSPRLDVRRAPRGAMFCLAGSGRPAFVFLRGRRHSRCPKTCRAVQGGGSRRSCMGRATFASDRETRSRPGRIPAPVHTEAIPRSLHDLTQVPAGAPRLNSAIRRTESIGEETVWDSSKSSCWLSLFL